MIKSNSCCKYKENHFSTKIIFSKKTQTIYFFQVSDLVMMKK